MTGRGGSASVRVKAGLDDMAVHVCGNLMNHNSMYLVDVWPGMDRGGDGGGEAIFRPLPTWTRVQRHKMCVQFLLSFGDILLLCGLS